MSLEILDQISQPRLCRNCQEPLVRKDRESKIDFTRRSFCDHKCAGPLRGNKPRTHCRKGHLLEETAYVRTNGKRSCRVCQSGRTKQRRAEGPPPSVVSQRCYRCDQVLAASCFYPDRTKRTGLNSECKDCQRDRHFCRNYGITLDEYAAMVVHQQGECAICHRSDKPLHVDHCHSTGRVRGLLCHGCNRALGFFGDDASVMRNAAEYIDGA